MPALATTGSIFIGQSKGLKNLDVLSKKQELENDFASWAAANAERNRKFGKALSLVKESYNQSYNSNLSYLYLVEAALGTEIIRFANSFRGLETALGQEKKDPERVQGLIESLKENTRSHFKDYNAPTDQKVMAALLEMYYQEVPKEDHPAIFEMVEKKYKGNFKEWAYAVFEHSSSMRKKR